MATIPTPINAETVSELQSQVFRLMRDLYEDRIGGLYVGDVFEEDEDYLSLALASSGGLEKVDNELQVQCKSDGGITTASTGILVQCKPSGGLDTDAEGLYIESLVEGGSLVYSGTVSGLTISSVDGVAFVDNLPAAVIALVTLSPGSQFIEISDSSGRELRGVLKAVGTGEALGAELITSWVLLPGSFTTWTLDGINITQAACGSTDQGRVRSAIADINAGDLTKISGTLTMNSGTIPRIEMYSGADGAGTDQFDVSEGSFADYLTVSSDTYDYLRVGMNYLYWQATDFALTPISWKKVTAPSANGCTIVSALNGTTYNFTSKDASFTYNAASYDVKLYAAAIAIDAPSPLSLSGQSLSLKNDADAKITEVDTGALADSDTVIPTSKAVKTVTDLLAPKASPTFTTQITTPIIALTGGQIAFPSAQSASADPNTLDDYEEGTWTPTLNSFTIVGDNPVCTGRYTKIGNIVYIEMRINAGLGGNTSVACTGNVSNVSGLPFTPAYPSACYALNAINTDYGSGATWTTAKLYPQTWSAYNNYIIISSMYRV